MYICIIFLLNIIYKLKIDRRYFFYQLSLTLTATFCLIALYHFGVVRNISSEDEVRKQAKMMAEHEWVFSDQMNRIFRSSHPTDFISAAEASRKAVVFIKSIIRPDELLVQNYSNTGSGVPVSYTHLDVYKRQGSLSVIYQS